MGWDGIENSGCSTDPLLHLVQNLTKVVGLRPGESQATGQVTSHRSGLVTSEVTGHRSGHKSQVRSGQVTGEVTGQVRSQQGNRKNNYFSAIEIYVN